MKIKILTIMGIAAAIAGCATSSDTPSAKPASASPSGNAGCAQPAATTSATPAAKEKAKPKKARKCGCEACTCATPCSCGTAPNTLSKYEVADGWKLLWDGKTSAGWVGEKSGCKTFPTRGWTMKDGILTVHPSNRVYDNGKWRKTTPAEAKLGGGGDIVTEKEYKDFILKLDFMLTPGANSGIKYFYRNGWNGNTCPEYQILHHLHSDHNPRKENGAKGSHRVASLYELKAANAEKIVKPAGEWNTAMIVAKKNMVQHWLNGKKVLEYKRGSEEFRKAVANSKYIKNQKNGPWGELESGRIKLQDHSDSTVHFRNIKIKEMHLK